MLSSTGFSRRKLLAGGVGALGLAAMQPALAASYPAKAVQLVVPFPPGGVTDSLARLLAAELQTALGQPFVVLNKPGAAGAISSDFVKNAAPDGYTLMMGHIGTHAVNPALYKNLSYDPVNDFSPIALVASTPVALYATASKPQLKDWQGVLAASRASSNSMTYASFGAGSSSHLYAELLQAAAGIKWLHVAYKGPAPAMQDLIGGQVDFMFDTLASGMPQAQAGRIQAVAVASTARQPVARDVPTFTELGIKGLDGGPWFGLFGPKNLPAPIVQVLWEAVRKTLAARSMVDRLNAQGISVINRSPVDLRTFQRQEIARWAADVKRFDIKVE
jgi:tripartite-type tricarboxylate transporter receptor subunit TctC